MDITKTNIFPYIEASFLIGLKDVVLTMSHVQDEQLPTHNGKTEQKFVLYFRETEKGLVLNKTNCKTIISLHGKLTENWAGRKIALYADQVKAFGELHDCIRIRPQVPKNGNGKKSQPVTDKPMPEAQAIPPADDQEPLFEEDPEPVSHYTHEAE